MNDKKGRHMTKDSLSGALSYKIPQYLKQSGGHPAQHTKKNACRLFNFRGNQKKNAADYIGARKIRVVSKEYYKWSWDSLA